jgi:bacterioferritin-associated ferredoxin
MIVCICRGKSDREINRAIEAGATSVRDLQRCGIGDQCGGCHVELRAMLTRSAMAAAEVAAAPMPCPVCSVVPSSVSVSA